MHKFLLVLMYGYAFLYRWLAFFDLQLLKPSLAPDGLCASMGGGTLASSQAGTGMAG